MADELFAVVRGKVKIRIASATRSRRRPGASRPRGAQDDRLEHPDSDPVGASLCSTLYGIRGLGLGCRPKRRSRSRASTYARVDAGVVAALAPASTSSSAVNPIAQIPTLVLDDGSVLTESAAILIHLGLAHPQSGLLATDPRAARAADPRPRLHRRQLLRRHRHPRLSRPVVPRFLTMPSGRRCRPRGRGRASPELWEIFADQFPATPWLSGERLGALDILAATVSKWSGARKALAVTRPEFAALMARIEADPCIAAVWARHWPKA